MLRIAAGDGPGWPVTATAVPPLAPAARVDGAPNAMNGDGHLSSWVGISDEEGECTDESHGDAGASPRGCDGRCATLTPNFVNLNLELGLMREKGFTDGVLPERACTRLTWGHGTVTHRDNDRYRGWWPGYCNVVAWLLKVVAWLLRGGGLATATGGVCTTCLQPQACPRVVRRRGGARESEVFGVCWWLVWRGSL